MVWAQRGGGEERVVGEEGSGRRAVGTGRGGGEEGKGMLFAPAAVVPS